MPLPKEHLHTIEDIYNLPDGQRAELIDGVIYDMAPPGGFIKKKERKILRNIFSAIQ